MIIQRLKTCESRLYELPIGVGGTVVGTGINTPEAFAKSVAWKLKLLTSYSFTQICNKFQEVNAYDLCVELSSTLNSLAISLSKMKH